MLSFVIVGANFNPPAVDNNTWTLKVLDANGQPVKDAVLSFPPQSHPSDPWMPDHTPRRPSREGVNNNDGTYTIAPLYFFMGGIWSMYIQAQTGIGHGQHDVHVLRQHLTLRVRAPAIAR